MWNIFVWIGKWQSKVCFFFKIIHTPLGLCLCTQRTLLKGILGSFCLFFNSAVWDLKYLPVFERKNTGRQQSSSSAATGSLGLSCRRADTSCLVRPWQRKPEQWTATMTLIPASSWEVHLHTPSLKDGLVEVYRLYQWIDRLLPSANKKRHQTAGS